MPRQFGIEIEAYNLTKNEVVALLQANNVNVKTTTEYTHRVVRGQWKVLSDASVEGELGTVPSFEIVSPPLSGAEGLAEARKVIDLLNEAGADVNKKCGIHVHVDANDLSPEHIVNVFNRYRENEEQIDAFMPRSRRRSNHSLVKSLRDLQPIQARENARETCAQIWDRYYKVNLQAYLKYGTIEFRHHGGSLNAAKITHWVNFLLQFVEASRPVQAQPVRRLTGKTACIVQLIADHPASYTAHNLADLLESTADSIWTTIARLKRVHGFVIHSDRDNRYTIAHNPAQNATATPTSDLWAGVDSNIVTYYERRTAFLGA